MEVRQQIQTAQYFGPILVHLQTETIKKWIMTRGVSRITSTTVSMGDEAQERLPFVKHETINILKTF
jgi:hypothetical protein